MFYLKLLNPNLKQDRITSEQSSVDLLRILGIDSNDPIAKFDKEAIQDYFLRHFR